MVKAQRWPTYTTSCISHSNWDQYISYCSPGDRYNFAHGATDGYDRSREGDINTYASTPYAEALGHKVTEVW